jgi:hypothetical protein
MQHSKTQIVDRLTVPLAVVGVVLFFVAVLVAMVADNLAILNVACGLIFASLLVSLAAGFTRHRYERSTRSDRSRNE